MLFFCPPMLSHSIGGSFNRHKAAVKIAGISKCNSCKCVKVAGCCKTRQFTLQRGSQKDCPNSRWRKSKYGFKYLFILFITRCSGHFMNLCQLLVLVNKLKLKNSNISHACCLFFAVISESMLCNFKCNWLSVSCSALRCE